MNSLEHAKTMLREGGYTCVLCKGEEIFTSKLRGVAPMLEFLSQGLDLKGFSVADKVVGKAPALLFVLAGIREVYAPVMTGAAVEVFAQHGIRAICEETVAQILNRVGDGPCPMERAVQEIDDPQTAFEAVKQTFASLQSKEQH